MTSTTTPGGPNPRAFWVVAPGRGELRAVSVPEPRPGQVRLRARFSGISRGTETLVFQGHVPPTEFERMRGPHQEGTLGLPVKYGYALTGELDDGRRVFCLHPHQSVACVDATSVTELPADVPMDRAVLAANMETALNATWDGLVGPGDRVVVVGAGVVGCLVAYLCGRMPGCGVQLVDIDARKASATEALGVVFSDPAHAWCEADVVFHASATGSGLQTAMDAAGDEARVVELSWYGKREVTLRLGAAFHSRRLQVVSSQVGTIPPARSRRWTHARRMKMALRLLADPALDALISGESAFEELPSTMARLAERAPDEPVFCHRIRY